MADRTADPGGRKRLPVPGKSPLGSAEAERGLRHAANQVADEADSMVPKGQQVVGGKPPASRVIDDSVRYAAQGHVNSH